MKKAMFVTLILLAVTVLVLAPLLRLPRMPWAAPLQSFDDSTDSRIFWTFRLPETLLAFLAGSGLAVSGMAFQAMFRNPLATPYTLGVASGASLGASLYVVLLPGFALAGIPGMSIFAFLGAVLAILIVYGITTLRRGFSTATLLLAGVAISFFFSSLILFMQYLSDPHNAARILRYVMGSLSVVGFTETLNVLPFVAAGTFVVLLLTHELNLMTTGEDIATSRGVNVRRTKTLAFFATSLMVGGIVAMCGPIGFVGMMAPHICRLLVGWNHRALAPATILFGGTFLVLCHTLAQSLPTQVPVGIVTAMLGGPFFLWLLLRGSSEKSIV